ncbi:MAG TPA: GNAT family protein, partial [Pseudonocardiaceae bacterium]
DAAGTVTGGAAGTVTGATAGAAPTGLTPGNPTPPATGRQDDPGSAAALLSGPVYDLRPITPETMGFLYQLAVSSEVGYRWRFRGAVPNYETFEASFWQGTLCQFVAVERSSGQLCGHVVCYNPEMAHGYGTVAAVFLPGHAGTGAPLQCIGAFVRYVFTVWPMRKLYLEVPSFNYAQFADGAGRLFAAEGLLTEHDYYAGRYWDRHVLAVHRHHVGLRPIGAR